MKARCFCLSLAISTRAILGYNWGLMDLSIVVPVYNEEENLPLLYQAVVAAVVPLNLEWELILVETAVAIAVRRFCKPWQSRTLSMCVWCCCGAIWANRRHRRRH